MRKHWEISQNLSMLHQKKKKKRKSYRFGITWGWVNMTKFSFPFKKILKQDNCTWEARLVCMFNITLFYSTGRFFHLFIHKSHRKFANVGEVTQCILIFIDKMLWMSNINPKYFHCFFIPIFKLLSKVTH